MPEPSGSPFNNVLLHASGAGAFFFVLQYFVLKESIATSLLWAVCLAAGAGWLAWSQSRR